MSTMSWMMFYYAAPSPERFVVEARALLSSASAQTGEALATFLGRLMAAHPERIDGWMAALADLPEAALALLRRAAWLSDTSAGRAHAGGGATRRPPDLLALEVTSPTQL